MPSPHHTIRPLITVIGATGTGKSQLAVDLARTLNGEIINADAMQMYEGLPIITNKMTLEERCGIQHHFLGVVPKEQEIRVGQWEGGVRRVIEEIRARGKLPIVVGGTHYYIQALLYPRSLLPDVSSGSAGAESEEQQQRTREDLARKYPILNGSTPQILQKLQEVDPTMAARWHPNDHRKIRRSLEIYYLHNCTPASEVYLLQKLAEREKASKGKKENEYELFGSRFRNLIFWVHAQPDVLNERLGGRVDKMVREGLFDEIGELWRWYNKLLEEKKKKSKDGEDEKEDEVVDLERGVLQSIGFKEFLPWLNARKKAGLGEFAPEEKVAGGEGEKVSDGDIGEKLEKLRREGLERMKIATVQYARTQVKWIRIKLMNAIREANEVEDEFESDQDEKPKTPENMDSGKTKHQPSNILYLMDSSNVDHFTETVSTPAISIAKTFLSTSAAGTSILPDPLTLSELAASCLKPKRDYDLSKRPDLWVRKTCEICGVTTVDQESWRKHEQSGRHKKMVRGRSKWEEAQRWKEKREKGELGNSKKIEREEEVSQISQ